MRSPAFRAAMAAVVLSVTATAGTFTFLTDPFAGSDALDTPGRQIVGGEDFIVFDIATDKFGFAPAVFGVGNQVHFIGALSADLPGSGVNVIALHNVEVPFAAGIAANLIAEKITTPGPGFFIYFNSGLNVPRLVFSTDLSDSTADLKILARMTNFTGDTGSLTQFTAANFTMVPEPSSFVPVLLAGLFGAWGYTRRRRR